MQCHKVLAVIVMLRVLSAHYRLHSVVCYKKLASSFDFKEAYLSHEASLLQRMVALLSFCAADFTRQLSRLKKLLRAI